MNERRVAEGRGKGQSFRIYRRAQEYKARVTGKDEKEIEDTE